jgi:adenosylcobyric acid synthase
MAKSIMIQGTASNVGKSLIAAGLCRIFKQDGFRVAPFKSQNMALNSFITREGLEMGRAQVVQAEAAGIEPVVDMNPILLKPTGDTRSQVIIQGEVFQNLDARQYYGYKKTFAPKIRESFERLSAAFDIIVIEGAGSPAEINLRENDIVNMFMAGLARAPVLLAGDIDRGGVFASLAGTMLLFTEEERRFVKGALINKFRGDAALLEPGLRRLEDIIQRPVLGVIPYREFDIDDEDSLTGRFHDGADAPIRIAVVLLPHISNFTDFNALGRVAGLGLSYARGSAALRDADLIIIPGTKNTMADLRWMRQNGMAGAIISAARAGAPVLGICGGYQMLGKKLKDPLNVEDGGEMEGMGLLPLETVFTAEKTRTRVTGTFAPARGVLRDLSGLELRGYEIHMGTTSLLPGGEDAAILAYIAREGGELKPDGFQTGNVYGTYVHGVFDTDQVAQALAASLYRMKGLEYSGGGAVGGAAADGESFTQYKERQYDLLAEHLRAHLDIEQIYRILNRGVED